MQDKCYDIAELERERSELTAQDNYRDCASFATEIEAQLRNVHDLIKRCEEYEPVSSRTFSDMSQALDAFIHDEITSAKTALELAAAGDESLLRKRRSL